MKPWFDATRKKWWMDLRATGGQRKSFKTKEAALQWERDQKGELRQWGASGYLNDSDRKECFAALDAAKKAGCTLLQAVEFWAVNNRSLVPKPLSEAIATFLKRKQGANRRVSYTRPYKWLLNDLAKYCGRTTPCHEVDLDGILEWVDTEHDWSLGTRKRRLGDVKVFFDFCKKPGNRQHWIVNNPLEDMDEITVDRETPVILTVDQCRLFLQNALGGYRDLVPQLALLMFGGLRRSEMVQLEPDLFKREHIEIPARIAKTRTARHVEINDTLRSWLEAVPLDFKGLKPTTSGQQNQRWIALRRSVVNPFPRNAIRHTAATYAYHLWGGREAAMRLGHSESVLHKSYRAMIEDKADVGRYWALTAASFMG